MDGLRTVLGRFPTGVAVVTVEGGGQPFGLTIGSLVRLALGLTIGSLVRLALEPPLVGFAVAREAALHELLRDDGACAVSLLAEGQDGVAEHFARGVPPIGMWAGIETEPAAGPPRLAGALGWLACSVRDEVAAGTHTLFVCEVTSAAPGVGDRALVRVRGGYTVA